MPRMLERIRRCHHCGIEVDRLPLDYEENPYCANCLGAAIEGTREVGLAWQRVGEYAVAMPAARTPR